MERVHNYTHAVHTSLFAFVLSFLGKKTTRVICKQKEGRTTSALSLGGEGEGQAVLTLDCCSADVTHMANKGAREMLAKTLSTALGTVDLITFSSVPFPFSCIDSWSSSIYRSFSMHKYISHIRPAPTRAPLPPVDWEVMGWRSLK